MKLLVFAHTPPPHHGQSYMVRLMLDGFGGDLRGVPGNGNGETKNPHDVNCYHVNARVSKELEDIGDFRLSKVFLLLMYCLQAVWCRFRYGVDTLYYVPAPGKKSALYRDWLVMFLCRPFYRRIVLHWHAAGLAKWLETSVQFRARSMTYHRMRNADLSIVLSCYNRADAEKLFPQRIRVVGNGIPDPCPGFERDVLPRRRARLAARRRLAEGATLTEKERADAGGDPESFRVLYLAHCTREKGLFDTVEGSYLANEKLAKAGSKVRIELQVAGSFVNPAEKVEFERVTGQTPGRASVRYLGFVSAGQKEQALKDADLFCFPTYYQNENQPVNLIEAMAFGLPIVTTRWRSLPELTPPGYTGLVDIRSPGQIADALVAGLGMDVSESFRETFCRRYTIAQYLAGLAEAFHSLNEPVEMPEAAGGLVSTSGTSR